MSDVDFAPLTIGLQYQALDDGKIDAADVSTTDGQLQRGRYVVLADPQDVFGFQNVTPIVATKVLSAEGPAFATTLNAVSRVLTTSAMQQMNAAVAIDKQSPADVAKQYLQAHEPVVERRRTGADAPDRTGPGVPPLRGVPRRRAPGRPPATELVPSR